MKIELPENEYCKNPQKDYICFKSAHPQELNLFNVFML